MNSARRQQFAQAAYNLDWFLFDTYNPYWEEVPDFLQQQFLTYRELGTGESAKVKGAERKYGYVD